MSPSGIGRIVSAGRVLYLLFPFFLSLPAARLPGLGLSFLFSSSFFHTRSPWMSPGLLRSPSSWRNPPWAPLTGIASPRLHPHISGPALPQVYGPPCHGQIHPGVLPRNGFWRGSASGQTFSFSDPVCLDWAYYPERLCGTISGSWFLPTPVAGGWP